MKPFDLPNIKQEQNPLRILGPAGEIFEFTRTAKSTGGKYTISKTVVPPGAGPTPHVHHETDEWFYTPNGGITLFVGQNDYMDIEMDAGNEFNKEELHTINMGKGELVYVPRHRMHAFINNTNKTQLLYMIWTPGSILNYFKQVGQVIMDINNPPAIEPLAKLRFVSEAPKFATNQSHNFWQYVKKINYSPICVNSNSGELARLLEDGENCLSVS